MTCGKGRPKKAKEVACPDCFISGNCLKHVEGLSTERIHRCLNLLNKLVDEWEKFFGTTYADQKVYDNMHTAEIELARIEKRLIVK